MCIGMVMDRTPPKFVRLDGAQDQIWIPFLRRVWAPATRVVSPDSGVEAGAPLQLMSELKGRAPNQYPMRCIAVLSLVPFSAFASASWCNRIHWRLLNLVRFY